MRKSMTYALMGGVAVVAVVPGGVALAQQAVDDQNMEYVLAKREERVSRGATGLNLDVTETPQWISIISDEQMRGFDIKNTQLDGIGMPNDWGIVTGDIDAYQYQQIEVIRGANGLLTGVGNSSGTLNFVRKRPTNQRQGELTFSGGSDSREVHHQPLQRGVLRRAGAVQAGDGVPVLIAMG